eukprot:5065835-Prymnesium_polylepis.1
MGVRRFASDIVSMDSRRIRASSVLDQVLRKFCAEGRFATDNRIRESFRPDSHKFARVASRRIREAPQCGSSDSRDRFSDSRQILADLRMDSRPDHLILPGHPDDPNPDLDEIDTYRRPFVGMALGCSRGAREGASGV